MPSNILGTYSPQALEPYNIETELAKMATGGSQGAALGMLGSFEAQRQANQNLYTGELENQRRLAVATIQQQLADRAMQELPKLAATPGALEFLRGAPIGQGVFGGADPTTTQGFINQSNLGNSLTRLKNFAETYKIGAEGGLQIPIGAGEAYSGVTGLQPMTPISTTNAGIAALNRPEQTDYTVPVTGTERNPHTGKIETGTIARKVGESDEHFNIRMRQQQQYLNSFDPANPGQPGSGGNVQGAPPATPGAKAQVQPDRQATPADISGASPIFGNIPDSEFKEAGIPVPGQTSTPPIKTGLTPAPSGGAKAAPPTQQTTGGDQKTQQQATKARPANMPDTGPNDVANWHTKEGVALQQRAQAGEKFLPPEVQADLDRQTVKLRGIMPIRVENNVAYYIASNGNRVGVVP